MKPNLEPSERTCGIFTLHAIKYESKIKIKHIQNMKLKEHEKISDTLVKRFDISKGICGEIYCCNIIDKYLMISKKLPLLYLNIVHEKPLRTFLLFRVYLYFTIETNVKNINQFLNTPLDGKFSLEISIQGTKKELNDQIQKYPGDEKIYNKLSTFVLSNEMKELSLELVAEIDKKLEEEYEKEFENIKPPTNIISLKDYKLD